MIKVLFVCMGNICRSPMAEGIFKEKLKKSGLEKSVSVDSAATGGWHAGEPPDLRAQSTLQKKGIDISGQKARAFEVNDFDEFDYIFVMDSQNFEDICNEARLPADRSKVFKFLEIIPRTEVTDVPDPYHGGADGFEYVFQLLDKACDILVEKLKNEIPS